jgi:hypothetical protein
LNQLFLKLLHSFGILLVALLAKLSNPLHELGRVDFVRHGGRGEDGMMHGRSTGHSVLREGNYTRNEDARR